MERESRMSWRTFSLVLLGMILGVVMLGPVAAHHSPPHTRKLIAKERKARVAADKEFETRTVWAKVDADATGATLLADRGAVAASRAGTGIFDVTFDRSVSGCGWISTLNDNTTGASPPGESSVHLAPDDPKKLVVRIYNSDTGTPTDPMDAHGFTVVANC